MFHFAGYRSAYLWIQYAVTRFSWLGCPIRKSPGQSLFAALRSLSQLVASFIACQCQGIHHVLLAFVTKILTVFVKTQFRLIIFPLENAASPRHRTIDRAAACLCSSIVKDLRHRPKSVVDFVKKNFLPVEVCPIPSVEARPIDVLVGAPGLEPGTSSLSEMRSNQLSYAP